MRWLLLIILFNSFNFFGQETFIYPKANASNQTDTIWGTSVNDPYRWMEKINSTETTEWLTSEKKLTDEYNKKTFSDMKACLAAYSKVYYKPYIKQGKYYFSFMISNSNETASLYYQQYTYADAVLLFNPNDLGKKADISIDNIKLSSDNKMLAMLLNKNGGDWQTIRFLDMKTQKILNDTINFVKYSDMYWYKNGIFYIRYDVKNTNESFTGIIKGRALYYHKLGTPQSNDVLIYKPQNKLKHFDFEVTPEEKYLILYNDTIVDHQSVQRVSHLALNENFNSSFKVFISVISDKHIEFDVLGVLNERLIVKSTIKTPTGAVFSYDPNGRNKREILVKPYANQLEFCKMVGNKILTVYSDDTSSYAAIRDSTGKIAGILTTPPGYRFNPHQFSYSTTDNILLCAFYSFFSPPTVYQYNLNTYKAEPMGSTQINFETKDFISHKVYYYSKDSTLISMYLTHKKKLKLDGNNPTLLYGYGGFNISMEPFFDAANVVFMKSGGVLATPCIRGGGDFPGWHEEGMGLKKQNSFDDFIGAAQYLTANNYTNASKLAAMGGSNGGLLVSAVMLQRPELFKAVVSEAGVLDMLRYHLYNIGYLWKTEYGNIKDSANFKNLLNYSPVHNVKRGINYPATLLTASDNDDRVNPFHSFKFLAELQDKGSITQPYLLYYEKDGGHNGSHVYDKSIETKAFIYSFIFKQLGMEKKIKYLDY
ncbi:MAG: prolyl oligopeptidase family serine peptidase [Bacteroidia bacterium]